MFGSGKHVYKLVEGWAKLPEGMHFGHVCDVANDSQDRVYVFQRHEPPVVVFDNTGRYVGSWGEGAFAYPHGLAIVDDLAYVVDRNASVCSIHTLDGKLLRTLGERDVHSDTGCTEDNGAVLRPAGPFNHPTKLRPSRWGDLYVADGHRNARVHQFDHNGTLIRSWGTWGKAKPGEFHSPHSVLVGRDDRVYVPDRENSRVQVFSRSGEFASMWTAVHRPQDIALTPDGDYVVCEGNPKQDGRSAHLTIFSEAGEVLAQWDSRSAHGVCVDSQGDIYLACTNSETVDKYERLR